MSTHTPTPLPRRAYSVRELAEMTGLSREYLYALIRDGEIPIAPGISKRLIPAAWVDATYGPASSAFLSPTNAPTTTTESA